MPVFVRGPVFLFFSSPLFFSRQLHDDQIIHADGLVFETFSGGGDVVFQDRQEDQSRGPGGAFGLGVGVTVAKNVKVNAAYFQTLYDDYDMTSGTAPAVTTNSFTRSNRVIGLGVDLKF